MTAQLTNESCTAIGKGTGLQGIAVVIKVTESLLTKYYVFMTNIFALDQHQLMTNKDCRIRSKSTYSPDEIGIISG